MDTSPSPEFGADYSQVHLSKNSPGQAAPAAQDEGQLMAEIQRLTHAVERLSQDTAAIKRHFGIH